MEHYLHVYQSLTGRYYWEGFAVFLLLYLIWIGWCFRENWEQEDGFFIFALIVFIFTVPTWPAFILCFSGAAIVVGFFILWKDLWSIGK